MLSVQVFGPGGHDRNTAPEYFGSMGVQTGRCEGATAEKAVPFPSDCPSIRTSSCAREALQRAAGVYALRSQIENYRAKAKKFARLAAVAKSPRHSRQCRKLAEMYWALAMGEEPERAPPSKSNVKGSTTWPRIP
jgi:hypothetical protein